MAFRRSIFTFNPTRWAPPQSIQRAQPQQTYQYAHQSDLHNHNVHPSIAHHANFDEYEYDNGYALYPVPLIAAHPPPSQPTYFSQFDAYPRPVYQPQAQYQRPVTYAGHYSHGHIDRPTLPLEPHTASRPTGLAPPQSADTALFGATTANAQSAILNDIKNESMNMKKEMIDIKKTTSRICGEAVIDDDDDDSMDSKSAVCGRSKPQATKLKKEVNEGEVLWHCISKQSCCKRDIARTLKAEPGAVHKALQSLATQRYLGRRGQGYALKKKYVKENVDENMDEYLLAIQKDNGSFFKTNPSNDGHSSGQKRKRETEEDNKEEPPAKKQRTEEQAHTKPAAKAGNLSMSDMQEHVVGDGQSDANHNKNPSKEQDAKDGQCESKESVKK